MLIFKRLEWSNAFSYGEDNYIDFTEDRLTQLVGKNGHGKSSIALILEEVLFNKNSKGIKKANIKNRHVDSKKYTITLDFEKNGKSYIIHTERGATQSVTLIEDDTDISAHTSTATYELIENILGFDHKTFSQIVYQSSPFSLEFLTTTDAARKRFLVDLLQQNIYLEIGEKIKEALKSTATKLDSILSKISTTERWIAELSAKPKNKGTLVDVPTIDPSLEAQISQYNTTLANIDALNATIRKNNIYRNAIANGPPNFVPAPTTDILPVKAKIINLKEAQKECKSIIATGTTLKDHCVSCGQPIDISHKVKIVEEARAKLPEIEKEISKLEVAVYSYNEELEAYNRYTSGINEFERNANLFNKELPTELHDKKDIADKIVSTRAILDNQKSLYSKALAYNAKIVSMNAEIDIIESQLADLHSKIKAYNTDKSIIDEEISTKQVLAKAFSPSGFIAYKLEALVKDLEVMTNRYLAELSSGRFQLSFKINSSDKLNVVITDDGNDIEISALSNGELARVNVSTLLAIRQLVQITSDSRTNLLILDETVESLDIEGKERLVEVLLKEEHLNVILVSHGFSHPLLQKLEVIKENNISRIE